MLSLIEVETFEAISVSLDLALTSDETLSTISPPTVQSSLSNLLTANTEALCVSLSVEGTCLTFSCGQSIGDHNSDNSSRVLFAVQLGHLTQSNNHLHWKERRWRA